MHLISESICFQAFVSGEKKKSEHSSSSFLWFGVWPFSQNTLFFLQALRLPRGPSSLALSSGRTPYPSPTSLPSPLPCFQGKASSSSETRRCGSCQGHTGHGRGGTGLPRLGCLPSQVVCDPGLVAVPFVWGGGSGVTWNVHTLTHMLSHNVFGHQAFISHSSVPGSVLRAQTI